MKVNGRKYVTYFDTNNPQGILAMAVYAGGGIEGLYQYIYPEGPPDCELPKPWPDILNELAEELAEEWASDDEGLTPARLFVLYGAGGGVSMTDPGFDYERLLQAQTDFAHAVEEKLGKRLPSVSDEIKGAWEASGYNF